jgi:8-oxo-dGTP pyrophosphatase MutT (NUDIX family)
LADVVMMWVPREIKSMPAFTTNVEFGMFVRSGRLVYGRPEGAPKTRYLDKVYQDNPLETPLSTTLDELVAQAISRVGGGSLRKGGECCVPLGVWKSPQFQSWYAAQVKVGNKLDGARVLWAFYMPKAKLLFCFALWVKVWIAAEKRYKENEFILSRTDISVTVPIWVNPADPLDSELVMIKEFRSPVQNEECYVYELPGGSSLKPDTDVARIAVKELDEETGVKVDPSRVVPLGMRQACATLATHRAAAFGIFLKEKEIDEIRERIESDLVPHGVEDDTERTYPLVMTVREALSKELVDWSMMGMIFQALLTVEQK